MVVVDLLVAAQTLLKHYARVNCHSPVCAWETTITNSDIRVTASSIGLVTDWFGLLHGRAELFRRIWRAIHLRQKAAPFFLSAWLVQTCETSIVIENIGIAATSPDSIADSVQVAVIISVGCLLRKPLFDSKRTPVGRLVLVYRKHLGCCQYLVNTI